MGKGEGESLVEGREKIRFLKNNREKHGIPEKYRRDFFFLLLKTNRATLLFKSPRDDLQRKIRGEIFFSFTFFEQPVQRVPFQVILSKGKLGGFWTRNFGRQSRKFIRNNTDRGAS